MSERASSKGRVPGRVRADCYDRCGTGGRVVVPPEGGVLSLLYRSCHA